VWQDFTELPAEPTPIIPKIGGLNRRNCDNLNTHAYHTMIFTPEIIEILSALNCGVEGQQSALVL
jgi:hypothetical protein